MLSEEGKSRHSKADKLASVAIKEPDCSIRSGKLFNQIILHHKEIILNNILEISPFCQPLHRISDIQPNWIAF